MKRNAKLAFAVIVTGMLFVATFLSGCRGDGGGAAPAPDMSPVGNGLSLIGMGIVLASIIGLIGIISGRPK